MPAKSSHRTPLLFIHGAWHGAWCWENFQAYFAGQGFASYALNLRGHGAEADQKHLRWLRISDYVADVAQEIEQLPAAPVLVGHSMGGFIILKYLERRTAPAAVLLAPAPARGSLRMFLRLALRHPWQMLKCHLTLKPYALIETPQLAREALFSDDIPEATLQRYFAQLQNESYRAGWDTIAFDLPRPERMHIPPMLVLGAANDRLFSQSEIETTARLCHAQVEFFPNLAHDIMLEQNWHQVAGCILAWLLELGTKHVI